MKNWTRTSLIFLAFSIGACESQAPTAPTSLGPATVGVSSGTVSGTSASGALGIRGGQGKGKSNDGVVFKVNTLLADCPDDDNAWFSSSSGDNNRTGLYVRWTDLTVKTKPFEGYESVTLDNDAQANVLDDKGVIHTVVLYIRNASGIKFKTDPLPIFPTVPVDLVNEFTIPVRDRAATVHQLKRPAGGPVVDTVGTICVGDLVFTP